MALTSFFDWGRFVPHFQFGKKDAALSKYLIGKFAFLLILE